MSKGGRRAGVWFGAALFGAVAPSLLAAQFAAPSAIPTPNIQQQLDEWYRQAIRVAPGTWGIAVAKQDGQLLWAMNPTTPMIPASTVKVFTTGYGRSTLGAEARRSTRVIGGGQLDSVSGAWIGTWSLEVNGDFTLGRSGRTGPSLADLARQLADQGIRTLSGPFSVISEGGEAGAQFPTVWAARHRGRLFAPPVGALTVNENTVTFRVAPSRVVGRAPSIAGESPLGLSSLFTNRARTVNGRASRLRVLSTTDGRFVLTGTIGVRAGQRSLSAVSSAPQALLEASWRHALTEAGITWEPVSTATAGGLVSVPTVLAEVSSQPFDSIALEVNSRSSNLGAELMLRWAAGENHRTAAEQLTAHVRQVTGDPVGVSLVDGSGLSEDDRASAWSFVAYLARFPFLPGGRNFAQLLPANGQGTLRTLANGLPAAGMVRAKTGTLANVATVTGYLGHRDGVLLISLLYNGSQTGAARAQQWRLFRLLGADGVTLPAESDQLGSDDASSLPPPVIP